jgi:hypothetical protein
VLLSARREELQLPQRSLTTVVRIVGTFNAFAAFASPMVLLRIIVGSRFRVLANWNG